MCLRCWQLLLKHGYGTQRLSSSKDFKMKRILSTILALFLAQSSTAQNPAQPTPVGANGTFRVIGYVLTTSPVNICTLTASASIVLPLANCSGRIFYVCSGDVNANAGTSATVTITDGQSNSFWTTINPLSSSNASSYNIPFGAYPFCRPFPSGIVVSASSNSTFTLSLTGYY